MLREIDTTSLRVFRAGFVPPLVDDAVTVTRLDKATSDLLPQELSFYRHIRDDDVDEDDDDDDDDEDDDDSYKFVAQQTPVDNNSLFSSVSFALTGQWVKLDTFCFSFQQSIFFATWYSGNTNLLPSAICPMQFAPRDTSRYDFYHVHVHA